MQNKQKWQTASLKRVKRRLIGRLGVIPAARFGFNPRPASSL
jgi:hypothetical protein